MADDTLTITITGDASDFKAATQQAIGALNGFGKATDDIQKKKPDYGKSLAEMIGIDSDQLNDFATLFDSIGTSAQRNFNEAVVGAESWQKAMTQITRGVETAFLNMVENEVAQFIFGEDTKTTATQAGNAARTASNQAAAATDDSTILGRILNSIIASAREAFAGVFGFLSPELGPAAAGPAAAAEATVLGVGSGIPGLAVGAWDLDGDTLAQLHQGEMVVPQTFAEGLRQNGGLGGGGDAYQVTINAMDSQSVKNLLQGNASLIAQIMQKQVRNFSSHTSPLTSR